MPPPTSILKVFYERLKEVREDGPELVECIQKKRFPSALETSASFPDRTYVQGPFMVNSQ